MTFSLARFARAVVAILLIGSVSFQGSLVAATGTIMPTPFQTVLDTNGNPVSGAKICTYLAGTTTPTATYTDSALSVANSNPIVADSAGRFTAYLSPGASYKFIYQDATGTAATCNGAVIKTVDNVSAVPASAANLDITGTAGEALTAGQVVYLSDGSGSKTAGQWFKADTTNPYSNTLPEVGIVPANIASGTSGTIRLAGSMTGLSSLTIGASYYVGAAGALTSTAPAVSRFVGVADTTSTLVLSPNPTPLFTNVDNATNGFRVGAATATCAPVSDITAATSLFLTPCTGNRLALYNAAGVATIYTSAEISIAVPATTSQMYDIFVFASGTTPTLELLAWTNDTTRATAIVRTSTGALTKSGDLTRRYVGSFRTTTVSGQTEDSVTKRYVWNFYNRIERTLLAQESSDSWTYSTDTWRQANGAPANQVAVVVGVADTVIDVTVVASGANSAGSYMRVGIGEDSTSAAVSTANYSTMTATGVQETLTASLRKYPAVGFHTYVWLERAGAATGTWYGDDAGRTQSGINGRIQG